MSSEKAVGIPEVLPIAPISLTCPYCGAKPNRDCATSSNGFAVLHVARIKAAAAKDAAKKSSVHTSAEKPVTKSTN